jgi:hypothetical protein
MRAPAQDLTVENQNKAMLHAQAATYRALYPAPFNLAISDTMLGLGLNPNDTSTNPATPEGIGNLAAAEAVRQHFNSAWNADVSE